MRNLKLWHQENCDRNDPLVIMITDFESSSSAVLHDFILILRYWSLLIVYWNVTDSSVAYLINILYLSVHMSIQ